VDKRKFLAYVAAAASGALAFNVLQFFAKGAHGAQTGFGPGEIVFFSGAVGVGVFMAINSKRQSGGASAPSKNESLQANGAVASEQQLIDSDDDVPWLPKSMRNPDSEE
jgi:hypothetical protein